MPVTRRGGKDSGPASSGARDRYVLVQVRPAADAVEASGFPADEWADFRSLYMSRAAMSVEERFTSDQTSAAGLMRWECEYLEAMDPDLVDVPKRYRLVYGGRPWDIIGASVIGRSRAIELVTLGASGV